MDYEVIIVGAGPAGSVTARFAAKNGAKTLILEKKTVVGEPVQCGEFLPTMSELGAILPNVENLNELFDLGEGLISRKTDGIRILSPKDRTYLMDFEGFSVNRRER